ncbi:MAG: dihydrodipicolinate synthase family protein [Thermomicrobiales bacterium]|nr:dihydrodipicolinate synthase family protein [Thermomicrobiales bacterium]
MREKLHGVWVAMPTPWQADGSVDAGVVRELVQRYATAGLHGAYTTGTDGEVHVLEVDELKQLVPPFAETAASVGLPVQVGCGWAHTNGVIERGLVARESGAGILQVSLPSWIPLADDELDRFYGAISDALPEMLLVHYNIMRSGRMMNGADFARVRQIAPGLAGSKHTGGSISLLMDIIDATPDLAHFMVDADIVTGALFGSPGYYSFIASTSPAFAMAMMEACARGDWASAAEHAKLCRRFFRRWLPMCPDINSSSALAKVATAAGIFPDMPLAIKEPYASGTQRHVEELRDLLNIEFSELIDSRFS